MFAELPENKHNDAPQNDRVYESDLLTLTTDVRMQKVPEIFASSSGHGNVGQSQGSGGGGPVEAVFWVKATMTQWRFRGDAYVVGEDIEGSGEESSGARTVKSKIGERMRVVTEEGKDSWSWGKELTAHFGNLSPGMRGSFKNPVPGSPVSIPPADKSLGLGQKVTDLHDKVARTNFRLVIIKVSCCILELFLYFGSFQTSLLRSTRGMFVLHVVWSFNGQKLGRINSSRNASRILIVIVSFTALLEVHLANSIPSRMSSSRSI